jgi:tRNA A-37 threonylcarbamoyl transferase component Bud32
VLASLRTKGRALARRAFEVKPYAAELLRDRACILQWLRTARRAQILAGVCLLFGLLVLPPVRDALLEWLFPPVERRGGFLGLQRRTEQSTAFEVGRVLVTGLYWLGAVAVVGWKLWMHIPVVLRMDQSGTAGAEPDGAPADSAGAVAEAGAGPADSADAVAETLHAAESAGAGPDPQGDVGSTGAHAQSGAQPQPVDPAAETAYGEASPGGESGAWSSGAPGGQPGPGRYTIEAELGRGGMGIVHRTRDTVLGRPVALKELLPELVRNPQLASRFRQEARVLAQLAHPNVVQIFDLVEQGDRMWMAMELVEGGSLMDVIEQQAPLSLDRLVRLGSQMADAMAYAHESGVVHRDFKPHNVMLTPRGDAKVTDFGLAKLAQQASHLTQMGTVLGSPAYMSPEQAAGKQADGRSDVYSLGVTLYQMATGHTPFEGDTGSMLAQHLTQPPPSPRSWGMEVPEALETLLLAMLVKDPEERTPDMRTVRDRLLQAGTSPAQAHLGP